MQQDTFIHPNNFTNSVMFSDILIIEDDIRDEDKGHNEVDMRVVTCVLLEMGLSFLGILTNLLGKKNCDNSTVHRKSDRTFL